MANDPNVASIRPSHENNTFTVARSQTIMFSLDDEYYYYSTN